MQRLAFLHPCIKSISLKILVSGKATYSVAPPHGQARKENGRSREGRKASGFSCITDSLKGLSEPVPQAQRERQDGW